MPQQTNEHPRELAVWLGENFRALPSVRQARPNHQPLSEPPPHVIVDTWMQATVFVYAFAAIPPMRSLRRLLTANTRAGLGSAFLLHRSIFTTLGSPTSASWLLAFSALCRERLFSYGKRNGGYELDQLRPQPSGLPGEFRLQWQEGIRLQRLAVSEHQISSGPLRGQWLFADLNSENRRANYASAARSRRAPLPILDATTRESFTLLGLSTNASDPEIRRAFRRLARETHPDVSTLPAAEAEARFRRLQDAYHYLLQHRGGR